MDFIEQQRKQIIDENNNGQDRLLAIIENTNKSTHHSLTIEEPLNGDLDLSVFNGIDIKTLVFSAGNITSLTNIPKTLVTLEIPSNLLIELVGLPSNLEKLDINHNYVNDLQFNEIKICKQLNISHNYFEQLQDLPPLLEELYCSNNKLTYINFENNTKLETIDIEYNTITIIDYFPSSIVNFSSENNPSIQYRDPQTTPVDNKDTTSRYDVNTSLNEYFRMKTIYEKKIRSKQRKIADDSKLSKKDRRLKAASVVGTCAHCKRSVGMNFSCKDRTYKVLCGSVADPCKLKVEIFTGNYNNVVDFLHAYQVAVIESQEAIIKQKMDVLFEYKTEKEGSKIFEEELKSYEFNGSSYKQLLDKYNSLFNDPTKQAEILQLKKEIFQHQETFNMHLETHKTSSQKDDIKEAMKLYIDEISPLKKRIFNLEHEVCELIEEKEGHFRLYKQIISSNGLDFTFFDLPEVKHFVV
jgi:hypothetical protein